MKENCFALLTEIRRAETQSGASRAFFVQKRFELRSAIATSNLIKKEKNGEMKYQGIIRKIHSVEKGIEKFKNDILKNGTKKDSQNFEPLFKKIDEIIGS